MWKKEEHDVRVKRDAVQRCSRMAYLFGGVLSLLLACTPPTGSAPTIAPTRNGALQEAAPPGASTELPHPSATPALTLSQEPLLPTATALATPIPATAAAPTATAAPAIHAVQPGETLLGLAMHYGVPIAALQLANDMGATVLQAGQTLVVPDAAAWTGASPFWVVRYVEAGETLSGIAAAYDLDVERLREVNDLAGSDLLSVGQPLVLPLDVPMEVAQVVHISPTATPVPLPTATAAPATPSGELAGHSPSTATTETVIPEAPPTATPAIPAAPPANAADWPRETVRLINVVRAEHGLPPLAYNETLARAAQLHAQDCQQRGWCSHTGSDGASIKERVHRIGYDGASWAECWAQRQSPHGAVDVWMDEVPPNDPHRRTLLTTWFDEVGVGIAETDWGYYFIADFGRKR